jgi:hypothetical protein
VSSPQPDMVAGDAAAAAAAAGVSPEGSPASHGSASSA